MNLEICDYVNSKKASTPREAAIAIVKLINQRDTQTSELAVALLDNLVKNCGYPFHLQISRKEFLNELVKKFPERPPMRYARIQRLVLGQIEEWYQTICKTSKYKDDFTYIKDMHRLLSNKGYIFPELKVEDAAVLNPSDNLKSMEDIRKEEAVVHSAKLQELIRRGKPLDLQEANKLMKIMAGFKDESAENKKQITEDLSRLRRKTEILNEMLDSNTSVDDSNQAMVELYSSIKSSQPGITKIIEEEQVEEDQDKVLELLALNDNINIVISKFQALKAGSPLAAGGLVSKAAPVSDNLIDFDDDSPAKEDEPGFDDLLSDLANLTFTGDKNTNPLNLYGSGGSISLGGAAPQQPTAINPSSSLDLLGGFNSPSPQLQSNTLQSNSNGLDPFGLSFPSTTPSQVSQTAFKTTTTVNQSNHLKFEIGTSAQSTNKLFQGRVILSNLQEATISQLKFSIAASKSAKLTLRAQLGDSLLAYKSQGVTQDLTIENSQDKPLKVKWKAEYVVNGESLEETGVALLQ